MGTDILTPVKTDHDSLPDHIAIGLGDEAAPVIDSYVADAAERIDEAVTDRVDDAEDAADLQAIVGEILEGEVVELLDGLVEVDHISVKALIRRRQLIAAAQRKHRFGRPILSYSSISYPKPSYLDGPSK